MNCGTAISAWTRRNGARWDWGYKDNGLIVKLGTEKTWEKAFPRARSASVAYRAQVSAASWALKARDKELSKTRKPVRWGDQPIMPSMIYSER